MTPFTHAMLGLMCQTQNNQIKKLWSKNETSSKQPNNENCIKSYISHFWDSDQQESRFSRILKVFFSISHFVLDLESFLFHFYISISISSHFHLTFIYRKEWKRKKFTIFLEKKGESFLKIFTIQGGCRTQNKVCQESFWILKDSWEFL